MLWLAPVVFMAFGTSYGFQFPSPPPYTDQKPEDVPHNNSEYVRKMTERGYVKSEQVSKAMLAVDFAEFEDSFFDVPRYVGNGMVASPYYTYPWALETLKDYLKPGCKAMDVGYDSLYLTVAMAEMVGPEGYVVGIEEAIGDLNASLVRLEEMAPTIFKANRVRLYEGRENGGVPEQGPYDAIYIGLRAVIEEPKELLKQLKNGGRMILPILQEKDGKWLMNVMTKRKDGVVREVLHNGPFTTVV